MKAKFIKRMLTAALVASLVMAPSLSAFAADANSDVNANVIAESATSDVKTVAVAAVAEEAKQETTAASTSTTTSDGTASVMEAIPTTSTVAGVKTSTAGVYLAKSVNGSVVTTALDAIKGGYGLTGSEKPYAKFTDLNAKKSPLAKQAIDLAAASQNAVVGPMLNVELGKMAGGKYSLLSEEGPAIRLSFGIPKNFQADATYAVVVVRAGGAVSILPDVDSNPNTVTFDTTGGAGAYAIIRY